MSVLWKTKCGCALQWGLTLVLCLSFLSLARMAQAQTLSVFGPQKYVRGTGKPLPSYASFRVPSEVTGCTLVVKDGANGPLSANNVSVTVNGVEMVGAKSLRAAGSVQTAVALHRENNLRVIVNGKPGDSIIVEILGEVPDLPLPGQPPVQPPGGGADRPFQPSI